MRTIAFVLSVAALLSQPALAQDPSPSSTPTPLPAPAVSGPAPAGTDATPPALKGATAPGKDHASRTGRKRKGAAAAEAPAAAPAAEADTEKALQAQRAAEARGKAWDAKMKKLMSGICRGC